MAKQLLTDTSIFESFHKLRRDSGVGKNNWEWFRQAINQNTKMAEMNQIRDQIASDPIRSRSRLFLGQMYFFFYNQPEYRTTLPFYDTFPLVLLISREKDTFFGINFHYIPPKRRLQMFLLLQKAFLLQAYSFHPYSFLPSFFLVKVSSLLGIPSF